jgi:hypothetical protein
MSKFQIEDGVPIPTRNGKSQRKYPLSALLVGQSFFVPFASDDARKELFRLSSVAIWHGKKTGKKFTVRTVEGGVRVWRVG